MQGRPTMLQCLIPVPSSLPAAAAKRRHTSKGTSASTALFLASASKQLARSLDVQVTLDRMAQVSVPDMGDACVILRFVDGRTTIELAAAPHGDAARQPLLTALTHLAVREPHGWQPLLSAASSGRAVMLSQLETAELLGDGCPAHVLLNDIGLKTALLVPVIHEERTLAVAVFFANRARYYTPLRVRAAQDLAGRFALAFAAAYAFQDSNGLLNETQEAVAAAIHDLSSPLTYIKGTVHGLRRAEQSVTDANPVPELSVRLNAIDVAVNRMTATLAALQQITRSVPSAPTPREGADLVAITHRVVGLEQLVARDHSIRVSETPVELRGFWDTVQLERLLANLIGNAVKYSPTGTCVDIQLRAEADTDGPWAVLQVSDQGVGIPACDLPFVFEPFRRGSNVGSVAGTGLGLASVYQIVKACAGRLGIDSKEGRGTSISVRLPLAEQAAN